MVPVSFMINYFNKNNHIVIVSKSLKFNNYYFLKPNYTKFINNFNIIK